MLHDNALVWGLVGRPVAVFSLATQAISRCHIPFPDRARAVLLLRQEERMDSLLFELIAVKFDLADKAREVERLKRELTGSTDEAGDEKDGKSTQSTSPVPEREGDTDLHSREMLFLAAEEGLDEIVKGILNPKPGHHHRALGATFGHAVRHAARAGHVNIIKRLLAVDAYLDVRSTDEDCLYQTCLHGAAAHGHEPVVRLILTHCKEKLVRTCVQLLRASWGHFALVLPCSLVTRSCLIVRVRACVLCCSKRWLSCSSVTRTQCWILKCSRGTSQWT